MEKIGNLIKLAALKQQSIRKSLDQAHGEASSVLSLTLQLKDFADQFEFVKDSLLKQAQILDLQAKKLAEATVMLEQRDREVEIKSKEIEEKLDNLQSEDYCLLLLKKWIQERSLEVTLIENQLYLTRKKVEDCNETLNMRRDQLALVQMQHDKRSWELDEKREQLGTIEKSIEECSGKLELYETKLDMVTVKLEEYCKDLYVKNVELASVEESLEVCSMELEVKAKEVERTRNLAANCHDDLEVKKKEFSRVKNLISDCDSELELKRKQLRRLQKWTDKYTSELDLKVRNLGGTEKSIDYCQNELDFKKESDPNRKTIQEDRKELDLKEKELAKVQKLTEETSNDLTSKERHLESIKVLIDEYAEELEAKEKQYDAINNSINKYSAELTMKQTQLESVENSIREKSSKLSLQRRKLASVLKHSKQLIETIKSKQKDFDSLKETMKTNCEGLELKLNAVQESIKERNEELALKEKVLNSVQMSIIESTKELESMKKQQNILKISIMECSEELESKKKSLDLVERSLKECCDELNSEKEELETMQRTTCGFRKELEEREEYLDSLKITLEQRLEKLQMKEREFEACVKELELREQKIDLMQRSVDERSKRLKHKEKQLNGNFHGQTMVVHPENLVINHTANSLSVDYQCRITDGKSLQLILNENLRKYDSFLNEIFTAIQNSPDPGKLVLDAVQGFYPTGLENGDMEFSLSVVRRSCTTLMGQLLKISPQVKPEVREEAMKVAIDWKSRMKTLPENSLEVLAYLQLLAAFKLASSFSRDEIQNLLDVIDRSTQALELQQAFGFAESLPADEQNPLQAHNTENFSTANVQSGATIYNLACPLILDDDTDNHELMPSEVLAALTLSPDPAKFVLDLLQGSYPLHCKNRSSGLDIGVAKSIAILLGQLIHVSPKISSFVKAEAIKLAVLWKSNITLEAVKEMEIWAFLLFLFIYGLVSYFRVEEILRLVVKIASHRSAHMMCHRLGFTDKIPELIQILIQNKQHVEAARFSCAFGLLDNFPLDIILQKCVEHVQKDAQEKATEKELAASKAIFQCITDYKLESRYNTEEIVGRITELEKQRKSSEELFQGNNSVEWQLRNQNSRDSLSPGDNNKRRRIHRTFSSQVANLSTQQ